MTMVDALMVKTVSGSTYQIIPEQNLARRVVGPNQPTPRQGKDGDWKRYYYELAPVKGYPMFFDWTGEGNGTLTTNVAFMANIQLTRVFELDKVDEDEST